ncbi:hypothetical protein FRC02_006744 [Tulasnella sp. 418]|nr:hypothetical protein FRC02_006744 [Tulasnella sp. 418]
MPQQANPEVWLPATSQDAEYYEGMWKCRVCKSGTLFQTNRRAEHENGKRHQMCMNSISLQNEELEPVPPKTIKNAAQGLLESVRLARNRQPAAALPQTSFNPFTALQRLNQHSKDIPSPASSSNSSPELFDLPEDSESLYLASSMEEEALDAISESLQKMVDGTLAIETMSDDEEVEISDEDDGADTTGEHIPTGGATRPRNYSSDESDRREWFPWSDKLTCSLDILAHLPRSVFSENQLDLLFWLLQVNGVNHVPSVSVMKTQQQYLQGIVGIDTIKYHGALGHTYYVNDIGQIIAQEMSNPRVRPHLNFYPEDAGSRLSEAWQSAKWLHKLDASLLTPMIRVSTSGTPLDYYVNEPTLLNNGKACIPHRWFMRNQQFC